MGRSKLDLKQVEYELLHLDRHQALYKLLKRILSKMGYWRLRPRGAAEARRRAAAIKRLEAVKKGVATRKARKVENEKARVTSKVA